MISNRAPSFLSKTKSRDAFTLILADMQRLVVRRYAKKNVFTQVIAKRAFQSNLRNSIKRLQHRWITSNCTIYTYSVSAFMSSLSISAVVAVTPGYAIGMNGDLPWQVAGKRLPNDLKYFRKMTTETRDPSKVNAVVFGRRTWESVPEKHRPLKNRINYVLTRNEQWARENLPEGVYSFPSLNDAVCHMQTDSTVCTRIEKAVIVGGVQLFEESLFHPLCTEYHITQVDEEFEADTHLTPKTVARLQTLSPKTTSEDIIEDGITYRMLVYDPSEALST